MVAKPIIVIGAGICGVSTAIWLTRMGHEVCLIDKGAPGMGASFGNAGLLASWAVAPVTSPSLWRDAPRMLLDPSSPLFLQWGYFPRLLPWLMRFMSHATDRQTRRIVSHLAPLLTDSFDQHKSLAREAGLTGWIADSKISFAYKTRADFDKDSYSWRMKTSAGFVPEVISGPAVREAEPILDAQTDCLAVLSGQGHITNPGGYVAALAKAFTRAGGKLIQANVQKMVREAGRIVRVDTDQGSFECSAAVITAGIWSKELMRDLGMSVPLETERGYHVLFENPSILPRNPMMIMAGKFGVTPMDMGLRCAGTVELGDHKSGPNKAPIALLRRHVAQIFPNLTYSSTREWMGFRPSFPDSLPMIGALGASGIYTAFGHQHVGLTAGPKTGRLIAQMISGQTPNQDMSAYDPGRYLKLP